MKIEPIPSAPRYRVSDTGVVYGVKGVALRTHISPNGYYMVGVHANGIRRMRTVHSLVLEAFVGPRPEGHEVCHKNGNRLDNRLENLTYGTRSENGFDSVRHRTNIWTKKTHCPQGHEYVGDNLGIGIRRSGPKAGHQFRMCRICSRRRAAEQKRKEVA